MRLSLPVVLHGFYPEPERERMYARNYLPTRHGLHTGHLHAHIPFIDRDDLSRTRVVIEHTRVLSPSGGIDLVNALDVASNTVLPFIAVDGILVIRGVLGAEAQLSDGETEDWLQAGEAGDPETDVAFEVSPEGECSH